MPQPQQLRIQAMSSTYTPAQGTTRSLTHWLRLGNEPASSCILVGFIIPEPQQELSGSFIVHKLHLNKITQREKGRKGGRKEGNCAQLCFGQDSLCVKYSLITKIKKKFSIDIELCQMSFTLCGGGHTHGILKLNMVESEMQLQGYTTATAMWNLSCTWELHHSSGQHGILNPLGEARDWTRVLMDASRVR